MRLKFANFMTKSPYINRQQSKGRSPIKLWVNAFRPKSDSVCSRSQSSLMLLPIIEVAKVHCVSDRLKLQGLKFTGVCKISSRFMRMRIEGYLI
jgi:hypothetical protein